MSNPSSQHIPESGQALRTVSLSGKSQTPPPGFVRSQYGILMRKNRLDATYHFCINGSYGQLLSDYLSHQIEPFVFVDIGANQGLYSILAALNTNCQRVVAFEPVSRTFLLLKDNIAVNGVEAIVHPVQAAVSLTTGKAFITKKLGHTGAASLRLLPSWFRPTEQIETLGPEVLQSLLPIEHDLIIKIDVEGHEESVLESLARSGVLNNAKAVHYEVNPDWSWEGTLASILRSQGFTVFARSSSEHRHDVLATR